MPGRKPKIGLGYFPLDTDLFQNKKITALRRSYGATGIATYINILCRVYGNGYYYKFTSEDELLWDIAEDIGNREIRKVIDCVARVIRHLIENGLIDKDFYERDLVITGKAMQEQYVMSAYKAKRKIALDTYKLVDVLSVIRKNSISTEEMPICSEEMPISTEEMQQREREEEDKFLSIYHARETEVEKAEREEIKETVAAGDGDDQELISYLKKKKQLHDLNQSGVFLSERQIESLTELLSPDEFLHYMDVVLDCAKKGHRPKSAYNFILQMAKIDRDIAGKEN